MTSSLYRSALALLLTLLLAAPAQALHCSAARLAAARSRSLLPRHAALAAADAARPPRPAASALTMMAAGDPKPPSVSKQALVDKIAEKAGVSKKTASLVLGATLDVIVDSVSEGNKVSLVGFGTFSAKDRPAREVRNPKTGEKMMVAAATVPAFTFGKSFKDAVKAAGATRPDGETPPPQMGTL